MKALSFSKLAFGCALILGVMVFWAAAAPSATGADSLIGGWVRGGEGLCCTGDVPESCQNAPPEFQTVCNPLYNTVVCQTTGTETGEHCKPKRRDQCDIGGQFTCPGSDTECE